MYPTDQELRNIVGYPKEKHKKGKHNENGKTLDVFQVPRNIDIQLEIAPVTSQDVVHLKFYSDFQWLLDFSLYGVLVYFMTEVNYPLISLKLLIFFFLRFLSVYKMYDTL